MSVNCRRVIVEIERKLCRILGTLFGQGVTNSILVEKLDKLVGNIAADDHIFFSYDEIPPNGIGSTKALHITTTCKGHILPRMLLDNGSSLNVMPLATLSKLPMDISYVIPSCTVVKAFNDTRREVMGTIEVPLGIGPCTYTVNVQVMDINSSYNCLLGRPWIHSAGVVPSSLHQKLKFVMEG